MSKTVPKAVSILAIALTLVISNPAHGQSKEDIEIFLPAGTEITQELIEEIARDASDMGVGCVDDCLEPLTEEKY